MKSIVNVDLSVDKINERWEESHKNGEISAVGKGNNGKNTNLDDEIDFLLLKGITVHTQYVLA